MTTRISTDVPAGRPWAFSVAPFDGLVYRNLAVRVVGAGSEGVGLAAPGPAVAVRNLPESVSENLWKPRTVEDRWNRAGISTLYTSTASDVSSAERVKHVNGAPITIVLGTARIHIERAVDLTDPGALPIPHEQVLGDDKSVARAIGSALYDAGVTALVVPAAITLTATLFPRMTVRNLPTGELTTVPTPAAGTNVVIFTESVTPEDSIQYDPAIRLLILTGLTQA